MRCTEGSLCVVPVTADACLQGGMPGSERLRDSAPLAALLQAQKESGKLYAAICAAPAVVFESQGLLDGPATSHPAFSDQLSNQTYAHHSLWPDKPAPIVPLASL